MLLEGTRSPPFCSGCSAQMASKRRWIREAPELMRLGIFVCVRVDLIIDVCARAFVHVYSTSSSSSYPALGASLNPCAETRMAPFSRKRMQALIDDRCKLLADAESKICERASRSTARRLRLHKSKVGPDHEHWLRIRLPDQANVLANATATHVRSGGSASDRRLLHSTSF